MEKELLLLFSPSLQHKAENLTNNAGDDRLPTLWRHKGVLRPGASREEDRV